MAEDVYRKLQEHLHQQPMGYPPTKSGVEINLLKKLFAEEEAKIALTMTPKPETPEEIGSKLRYDSKVLGQKLEAMARKGLIMRERKENKVLYNLIPYVVGMYEFQINRLDGEFIALHEKYGMEGFGAEVFGSKTPYFRVIPVQKSIPAELAVLTYERVFDIIDKAETIAVTDCICRTKQKMAGKGCEHTIQNCLVFSPWAEYYLENEFHAKEITKDEARKILEKAEEEGLVHTSQNTASGPTYICNCCSCSCGVLSAVKNLKLHSQVGRSYYLANVNEDLCTGCEECVDRCHFGAISVENSIAKVNPAFCMGCGVCKSGCPAEAISLNRKPEDQFVPPSQNLKAMFDQIGKEKGRGMKMAIE
jgi:electron transport complex protein RnfB